MNKIFLLLFSTLSIPAYSQTVGLFYNNPGSFDGYVLFAPGFSDTTYLIDKCGKRIHEWNSSYQPGLSAYLLNDGTLLRCGNANNPFFLGGGRGGIIEKLDWNSNIIWTYQISSNFYCQHHDAIQLPNGNVVAIVWEYHTKTDAQMNGVDTLGSEMWSETIMEIKPEGFDSGTIVWQWRAWDHLIQDVDNTKLNYGNVYDHPELLDVNLGTLNSTNSDWLHFNGLDYDSTLDQLMISCHNLNEVYIIDHSTTLAEAATESGKGTPAVAGAYYTGGGNPQNYDRGTMTDQKFYGQHHTTWIPQGMPGAGKILVFNNGVYRPGDDYSTVETITPPAVVNYNYPIALDSAFLPTAQDWIYTADPPTSLFSVVEGGAQRLANGNTLICEATYGTFIEVDSLGNEIWQYINPVGVNITSQGDIPLQNVCFRATFIPSQYPGLAGQALIPGGTIELNPLNYSCVNYATGTPEISAESPGKFEDRNLTVYPNPFQNSCAIHVPVAVNNATLQVHDVVGKLIYQVQDFRATPHSDVLISLPQYKGVMIVSIKDKTGGHLWNMAMVGL